MAAPKTVITYDLDGSNKDFEVPFEYLARKFVVVTLIGTDRLVLTPGIDYRFSQRTIITTTQSWGAAQGYNLLEIRRLTSATERLVDFSDGSVLRAYDLNISNVQSLHIAEEGRDIATDTIGVDNNGNLDARGRRIVNMADGVNPGDAVTVRQAEQLINKVNNIIGESRTLLVPQQYPTIHLAMDYLRQYMIMPPVTVTIQVQDGHVSAPGLNLNHPQGINIRLLGNVTDPSRVKISGPAGYNGDAVTVTDGNAFGFIDGFTIDRPVKAEWPFNGTGFLVHNRSFARMGKNMVVRNWFYSAAARNVSNLQCPNLRAFGAGDVAIWSYQSSHVQCDGATVDGASADGYEWGFGFQAEYGSTLSGDGIYATNCKIAGIASLSRSMVNAPASVTEANARGYFVRDGSGIQAHGGTTRNNTLYGEEILDGNGSIAGVAVNTGNAAAYNRRAAFATVGSEAALIATGSMRYDTTGSNPHYFNTGGGLQFSVGHRANATSYLRAIGGDATTPATMGPLGNAVNLSARWETKGSGAHEFYAGGREQVNIKANGAAVNKLSLQGGATGQPVIIGTEGSDVDRDILLAPAGVGRVRFGTYRTNDSNWIVRGYVDIKSESGQVLHVAVLG